METSGFYKAKVLVRSPRVDIDESRLQNPKLVGARVQNGAIILEIEEQPDAQQDS